MRKLLLRSLLVLTTLAGAHASVLVATANFHVVVPDRLYRSAQPTPSRIAEWKARFGLTTIINLRLFAEPARLLRPAEKPAWLSNLNVTLEVRNLFDAYQRVLLGDGSVPAGYERYEIDPLGRTVQLSVRKRF